MKISNKGLVELVGHEGVCLSKYKDSVGVWTIGIGATKSEISDLASWPLSKTITMQEAFELLKKGVGKYEEAINKSLTKTIRQPQFDALVSWCYNVGTGWAKKASIIKYLNQGIEGGMLFDALMMYNKPKEIIGRRTKEAKLITYGEYSNGGKALLFPVSASGHPVYKKGTSINVWEYIDKKAEVEPVPIKATPVEEKAAEPSLMRKIFNLFTGDRN